MKFLLTLIFFSLTTFCYSQSLNYFRLKTDSIINKYFDSSIIKNINCEGYNFSTFCHGDAAMRLDCGSNEMPDKVDGEGCKFILIDISYSIYSLELGYNLPFSIPVDNKYGRADSILSQQIPECIKKGESCKYISKDSALKIANKVIKNKKQFWTIEFNKNPSTGAFYWETNWLSDTKNFDYTTIRINAKTGKIIK